METTETETRTRELLELDSKYCSFGDTVHYYNPPKIFADCDGSYLFDEAGTSYLDLQMWYSAVNFGYKNPRLNQALKKQIDKLPQLACQYLHAEKIEVATRISQHCEKAFGVKGRVHFNVGGSQAIEDAIKIVRNATGRNLMFAFQGSYHGRTLAATSITSSYRYRRSYNHFGERAHFAYYPYCFRCKYDKTPDTCGMYCEQQFAHNFDTEYASYWDPKAQESEFSAFFAEPVQGTGGYIVPPREYFPKLKATLDQHKILFVDDEIQMGFYRTGKFWGIEHFDVKPDIIVFGKALTNGLNPISGLWAKEDLISPDVFPPGMTHSTFSSNPLGTAVALETLKLMEDSNYEERVPKEGAYFLKLLKQLQGKYPRCVADVTGLGLALRMEMCKEDGITPDQKLTHRIAEEGLKGDLDVAGKKYGLVLDVGGYYKNVFTIAPSLEISRPEMDLAIVLLDQLFARCGVS
jgi:4-aminobutyrate aminotransferase / (S)-3-amino-2-methylpropionate transaminase / 5-aminovalerate transaminase